MMRTVCFTVDVDRDAAWFKEGTHRAITFGSEKAVFEASCEGLVELVNMLNELKMRATFFFEARTALELSESLDLRALVKNHEVACHGFDHEDFTGELTGVRLSRESKKAILLDAKSMLERIFGTRVSGFRAPYLHADDELLELLKETGFAYDSSLVSDGVVKKIRGLYEIPFLKGGDGKPSLYLWKLMEGKEEAGAVAERVKRALSEKGFALLATHSWHAHRSVEEKHAREKACANIEKIRVLLEEIAAIEGIKFAALQELI